MKKKIKRNEMTKAILMSLVKYERESGSFTWAVSPNRNRRIGTIVGYDNGHGYKAARIAGTIYMIHHLVWLCEHGRLPTSEIDHINRNSVDNRICNLREVSRSLNGQNRTSALRHSKTGILGVTPHQGQYQATIGVKSKQIYLGRFKTAEEARIAYERAKIIIHPNAVII